MYRREANNNTGRLFIRIRRNGGADPSTQESSTTYEPTKNHLGKPRGSGVFLIDYLAEVTIEEAIA